MTRKANPPAPTISDISKAIWETRYRLRSGPHGGERRIEDTWRRVAVALAGAEANDPRGWEQRFYGALENFRFLPGGRILAGAGSAQRVTLFNCFVMGRIADSLDGIFDALKEGAITMQQGGGVGYDFSTLRPRGMPAPASGAIASGPVSFMHIWDSMCATLLSTGLRRGAMIGTLRCDHPDIEEFVDAKRDARALRRFNLSVLVTDEFMRAISADAPWPLVFPEAHRTGDGSGESIERAWPGDPAPQRCRVHRRTSARSLWERIVRAAYDCGEPGVLFIDRIQRWDNLQYCEQICATNPCGEIPLPAYGACDLGSINLTRFVRRPFTGEASLDLDGIAATAAIAVRMLDNVYEISHFPLPQQEEVAKRSRRLGLGLTGLADALIMLGVVYGSERAMTLAGEAMRAVCHAAYRASVDLAREKGAFPQYDARRFLRGEFIRGLPADIVAALRRDGIRNSHLVAMAPTGSISLLAGNVSSSLEPVYAHSVRRRIRFADGNENVVTVDDYACRRYREQFGADAALPPAFVDSARVTPSQQIAMQAALQRQVDNAIAKTVNVPAECDYAAFRRVYDDAWRLGLKGCAAFRPNPITGVLLAPADAAAPSRCGA